MQKYRRNKTDRMGAFLAPVFFQKTNLKIIIDILYCTQYNSIKETSKCLVINIGTDI